MANTRIESGSLTCEITLQVDVGTGVTAAGQPVNDWQDIDSADGPVRWAGIRQLSGREYERANQMQIYATHMITMYWEAGITAVKMRAKLGERYFQFGVVDNVDEANIKLEILAIERIA